MPGNPVTKSWVKLYQDNNKIFICFSVFEDFDRCLLYVRFPAGERETGHDWQYGISIVAYDEQANSQSRSQNIINRNNE